MPSMASKQSGAWKQSGTGGSRASAARLRALGRVFALVSLIGWMGVIFYLSSLSNESLPTTFLWLGGLRQVVAHFGLYAVLGGLSLVTLWAWTSDSHRQVLWVGVVILFGLVYGVLDEFHQSFVAGRSSSLFDLFIDSVGVVAGVMSIRELDRRAFQSI